MSLPGPQLPWPAQRRPLSVVAFGNSVATLQLPGRADRSEGSYVEVLADVLSGEGVPTVPHLVSQWFSFLVKQVRDYERTVRVHAPDVIVVQFGLNEYQPWLLPIPAIRHLMITNQAVTRTARTYRRLVAPRLWTAVREYRRHASGPVGQRTWQTTPRRFGRTLEQFLRNVRREGKPLVLVLDLDAPDDRLEHFLPGMRGRHAVFQEVLTHAVANLADPEVRLVRVSAITAALGAGALPDGMHYSPATHEAVGRALAEEVLTWLKARACVGGCRP
jgi:lysophospholipase L1-like esterase